MLAGLHALRASRAAVAAAFLTQGMLFISLTTRLPDVQRRWDLTPAGLSVLLLVMVLLAGAGSALAEVVAGRRDSAVVLRTGLLGIAAGSALVLLAPAYAVLVAGLAVYGVGLGVVDAATNMQAVALEHRYGRPILPSFHGAWTLGGVLGSLLTLATSGYGLRVAAVLALVPLLAAALPFTPRAAAVEAQDGDVPWRAILLVGLALVLFYMVDTAASTWGPTYLDRTFATPARLVALATLPYLVAQLAVRVAGDALVVRVGPTRLLRVGALVAALALALVVFATSWPLAVVGFTVLGAGVGVIAPLSFSAAARIAGGDTARVDRVVARFNQFNYVGALLGAVLTGLVGADSLRYGFALPMVLVLGVVALAPAFA